MDFFDTPNKGGKVTAIKGRDVLENGSNIIAYKLNFDIGDEIKEAENDSARIGFYIAYAESKQELEQLMNEIKQAFQIELED